MSNSDKVNIEVIVLDEIYHSMVNIFLFELIMSQIYNIRFKMCS
jgi:hypothetical protein